MSSTSVALRQSFQGDWENEIGTFISSIVEDIAPRNNDVVKVINKLTNSTDVVKLKEQMPAAAGTSRKIDNFELRALLDKIESFGELIENWDGFGSIKPDTSAIEDAARLAKMLEKGYFPDRAGISGDGEISLIWESGDLFADFGVTGDGTYSYFIKRDKNKLYGDEISLEEGFPEEALSLLAS